MRGIAVLILTTCVALSASAQQVVLDKVIAKVGNEYILNSEVEERYALAMEKEAVPAGGKCTILEELLVTNLLVHHARIDSFEVSEEEVEAQLEQRIDRILGMMGNDPAQFEDYYKMTIQQAKELNRQDLRKKLNAEKMRAQILQGITVTPAEVVAHYEQIPRDSLPYFNSEVEIAEIVYKPKVNDVERQKAIDQANELLERIKNGDNFEDLARLYSDDPGSARQNGSLGRTPRGTFVQEFEAAAYRLDEGEISDVVESEFGFHIIRLDGRYGNIIETSHILVRPTITSADLDTAVALLNDLRMKIMNDSMTFEAAVKEYSDENTQSYSNGGRVSNPATGNTFFETSELDHQIFFAIDTIEVGEITAPIEYRSPTGEVFYKLIMMQSRTPPHRASLKADYSKIQNAARAGKQADAILDWIKRKVAVTYITIDEKYSTTCPNLDKWKESGTVSRS